MRRTTKVTRKINRKNGDVLLMCAACGSLNVVKDGKHMTTHCVDCKGPRVHLNTPTKFQTRTTSGVFYRGPTRVPSEYLP